MLDFVLKIGTVEIGLTVVYEQLLEGSFEDDKGSLIEALRKVRLLGGELMWSMLSEQREERSLRLGAFDLGKFFDSYANLVD